MMQPFNSHCVVYACIKCYSWLHPFNFEFISWPSCKLENVTGLWIQLTFLSFSPPYRAALAPLIFLSRPIAHLGACSQAKLTMDNDTANVSDLFLMSCVTENALSLVLGSHPQTTVLKKIYHRNHYIVAFI